MSAKVDFKAYQNDINESKVFGVLDDWWKAGDYLNLEQGFYTSDCHPEEDYVWHYKAYQDAYITTFRSILYLGGEPDIVYEQTITHTPEDLKKLQEEQEHCDLSINGLVLILKDRGYKNIKVEKRMEEPYWTESNKWEFRTTIKAQLEFDLDTSFAEAYNKIDEEMGELADYNQHPYGCFLKRGDKVIKQVEFVHNDATMEFIKC